MGANHHLDYTELKERTNRSIRDLQGQLAARPRLGTATLVAGSVTVALSTITAASQIFVGMQTPGGTVGAPFVFSKTAGTGFVIHSTSATDTSVIAYAIY